ncbi:ATP-binding cassette domain-containing protein [Fodinicola feengrottensis]|uniref:ATP-binding cassette domain-containing protein n=1 Tax=Fodinicola feengrottensis TaxID=435914 RepID=UPI00244300E4|nr:ATP-binding cassette domain-containing protein [Fodinicola feengrottensis]
MFHSSLIATDLVKGYGDRRILNGISVTASPGHRLGLVGENGIGKSTLLRLLAGAETPDSGTVVRPPDHGFLAQELPYDPRSTVASVIDDALSEIRTAQAKLDELTAALPDRPDLLDEYGDVLEWAQAHTTCGTPTGVPSWSGPVSAWTTSAITAGSTRCPVASARGSAWRLC